jgi:hypothetical protein
VGLGVEVEPHPHRVEVAPRARGHLLGHSDAAEPGAGPGLFTEGARFVDQRDEVLEGRLLGGARRLGVVLALLGRATAVDFVAAARERQRRERAEQQRPNLPRRHAQRVPEALGWTSPDDAPT